MGRPSEYTVEKADDICEHIAEGKSLSSWARENDYALKTIYRWLRQNKEFSANYARAREDAADSLVDKLMDIADNEDDVQRAKLKSDNVKWVASRMKPKSYGDKIQQDNISSDGSMDQANSAAVIEALKAKHERKPDS